MKQQIHYKESQPMYWLVAIFTIITVFIILATYFQWGSKPIPSWWFAMPIMLLNVLIIIALHNMQIVINSETACVKFGIGWLQRKIPIKDLDLSTTEIIHLPWYAGVGYRIHNRGTFFNTKPGPALLIDTKSKNKKFFVGTKHGEKIIAVIKDIQNTNTTA